MPCGELMSPAKVVILSALPSPSVSTHSLICDRPILRSGPLLYSSSPTNTLPSGVTASPAGLLMSGDWTKGDMTKPSTTLGVFGAAVAVGAVAGPVDGDVVEAAICFGPSPLPSPGVPGEGVRDDRCVDATAFF